MAHIVSANRNQDDGWLECADFRAIGQDYVDGCRIDGFEWDDSSYGPVPGPVYHF